MYTLNGWWFLSSSGSYPPVFTVVGYRRIVGCLGTMGSFISVRKQFTYTLLLLLLLAEVCQHLQSYLLPTDLLK